MTAGWMRTVGQVTAVVTFIVEVAWASAPIVDQTKRAVSLLVVPGVVVVGDPQPFEAGVLGHARLRDELARAELLAGQEIADPHLMISLIVAFAAFLPHSGATQSFRSV